MVCIAKSVYEEAKVIIFDEPTALLTEDETERLFNIIRDLKEREISVIYISHRLEEIFEICDRTTIPVSYTHLDVYKRQLSASTRGPES